MSIFHHHNINILIINYLNVDDLRSLYQVNKYCYNLIKPFLDEYILFFQLNHGTKNELFLKSIKDGNLNLFKYLFKYDNTCFCEHFYNACIYDHLNIVKVLKEYQHGCCSQFRNILYQHVCEKNNLIILKFLDEFETSIPRYINISECCHICSNIDIIEYIINTTIDTNTTMNIYFKNVCMNNNLEIIKWFYEKYKIHINVYDGFISACVHNKVVTAQWLYKNFNINIHTYNDEAFTISCYEDAYEVAEWLCSIEPQYHINIKKTYLPIINY